MLLEFVAIVWCIYSLTLCSAYNANAVLNSLIRKQNLNVQKNFLTFKQGFFRSTQDERLDLPAHTRY